MTVVAATVELLHDPQTSGNDTGGEEGRGKVATRGFQLDIYLVLMSPSVGPDFDPGSTLFLSFCEVMQRIRSECLVSRTRTKIGVSR